MHILWLKTEFLHPVDKGGRIRTYQMLRAIAREHRVTYLTLDDGTAAPDAESLAREYSERVVRVPFAVAPRGSPRFFAELAGNLVSPLPYAVSRYRSARFEGELRRLAAAGDVDVVVCDFLAPAVNLPPDLPVPVVLFQHNVEAEIWRRHAEVRSNPVAKRYFGIQFDRMVRFEREVCRRVAHVVAVSEADERHFRERYGVAEASAVATGVDTAYFAPSGAAPRRPYELVFTGSMDWLPNEDGIAWFAERVLPRIRAELPEATLTVVGRNPTPAVLALGGGGRGIEVVGRVPDVRPFVERAALFVVPLRIGGGTRLKIYEAMAMGAPVVSTTVGAEGLPLRDGEHLALADEPEAFARACVALLRDRARAEALGARAQGYVRAHFDWERVAADFAATCARVARRGGARPAPVGAA